MDIQKTSRGISSLFRLIFSPIHKIVGCHLGHKFQIMQPLKPRTSEKVLRLLSARSCICFVDWGINAVTLMHSLNKATVTPSLRIALEVPNLVDFIFADFLEVFCEFHHGNVTIQLFDLEKATPLDSISGIEEINLL